MKFTRKEKIIFVLYALVILCLLANNYVFAANEVTVTNETIINQGTGINDEFDKHLKSIAEIFIWVAKMTVIILTATAAIMVGLGIEDGKRTLWNWLLGAGLAVNFGWFVVEAGLWEFATTSIKATAPTFYTPEIQTGKGALEKVDILSKFMDNYLNGIIIPGSKAILPACMKLLVILTIIEATWNLAFKLVSGDKIKYLLTLSIKCGFFLFIMYNWIEYMGALSNGFQELGFTAGGSSLKAGQELKPDSIWHNATVLFTTWFDEAKAWKGLGSFLVSMIGIVLMLIVVILTAIEMFMARIEFYTMALLTIPLLAFGVTSKFGFLTDKAIGAMVNLSIKLCAISFITAMAFPFWNQFAQKAKDTKGFAGSIEVILQCALVALLIYMLIKKIPELVAGLLNGQPALSGASMLDTARSAMKTAGTVAHGAATVASGGAGVAGAAAGAVGGMIAGGKAGGVAGALSSLGKSVTRGALDAVSPVTKPIGSAFTNLKNTSSRQFKRYNAGNQSLKGIVKDPGGLKAQDTANTVKESEKAAKLIQGK